MVTKKREKNLTMTKAQPGGAKIKMQVAELKKPKPVIRRSGGTKKV